MPLLFMFNVNFFNFSKKKLTYVKKNIILVMS